MSIALAQPSTPAPSSEERRRYERYTCPHNAQTFFGLQWRDCEVEDISAGGASILAGDRPAVGQPMTLFVEDVAEMPGVVGRHTAAGYALRFDYSARALP
ncbi:MAG: PilZ domain-containing protein [Alphaproteobacteria bacterium]